MSETLLQSQPAVSLTRDELERLLAASDAKARQSMWALFLVLVLLLSLFLFGGALVVREQVRMQADRSRHQLMELYYDLHRLEDQMAASHKVIRREGAIADEEVFSATAAVDTSSIQPTLAKPLDWIVETEQSAPDSAEPATSHVSTEAGPTPAEVPRTAPPAVFLSKPDLDAEHESTEATGSDRKSNRGVTVPPPVTHRDSSLEPARKMRATANQGISFSPTRAPREGIVVIGPARSDASVETVSRPVPQTRVQPVAFEKSESRR